MCGIFGYTGKESATPFLLDGLRTLEYRGYDSAGIYVSGNGSTKAVGHVAALAEELQKKNLNKEDSGMCCSGIAHTRWATHGIPSITNAHPHHDGARKVWVVHNGIIENYREIKEKLSQKGVVFESETDTEVIPHLIADFLKTKDVSFEDAVIATLKELHGTYGLAAMIESQPEKIIVARMGSPIVIGLGEGANFVASDPAPILRHTRTIMYLHDGEIAVLTPTSHSVFTLEKETQNRNPDILDWNIEEAQKNGYEHFMMKEMMEAPQVVKNTTRGRLLVEDGLAKLGGLESVKDKILEKNRLIIVGCGTAYYAGLIGEYIIEEYAGIPVEVEIASEFRYRTPIIDDKTMVLAISQSGETADTLEAIREAKRKGALTLGIINTVGSTIARETDAGIYNHAGPEIGVASTKAFISQLTALTLLAVFIGRQRSMSNTQGTEILEELAKLPEKIEKILAQKETIKTLAEKYGNYRDFLYMGRKYSYPIAFEGALKLKEISYIHAEGIGAGEMKHGSIAMIDENFPTVVICPTDSVYQKMQSNIQEIKARKGKVLAIATEGNIDIAKLADDVIYVPQTIEALSPILSVIPLQLFAYYVATNKGFNVDKPRNLAKSVTVE